MFKKILAFFTGGSAESKSTAAQTAAVKDGGGSLRDLEAFVEFVVKPLVDDPDAVSIKTVETEEGASIQIRCRKEDIGKIVGKHGKTIMAIRSLVIASAGRRRQRVSVDVLD